MQPLQLDSTASSDVWQTAVRDAAPSDRPAGADPARMKRAGVEFEAMFLRQFLEIVMPKDDSGGVYGGGPGGSMWRSMLADNIAKAVAQDSPLGLAEKVAQADAQPPEMDRS